YRYLDDRHHAGRVAPDLLVPVRDELAEDPVGGPPYRRDGRDAEPFVDLGPLRVVDSRDHPGDAEGLPGQPGRDDVGVVSAGHRGWRVSLPARTRRIGRTLDGRGQTHLPAEASADRPAVPVGPDAPHAAAQAHRAAGVRLRRAVVGRLRT